MARDLGISAHRLLLSSDAVLEAVRVLARPGGRAPYPPSLVGSPTQPSVLDGFTMDEVTEATRMLMRLGFLEGA
jgi:hypothetical protein